MVNKLRARRGTKGSRYPDCIMYVGGKLSEKDEDRSKSVSDTNLACYRRRGNVSWTSLHRAVLEDPREALEAVGKETLTGLFSPRLNSRFKHDPGDH